MKRREFLLVSAGAGGAVAASGQAAGREQSAGEPLRAVDGLPGTLQQEDGDETNGDGQDEVVEVELGNYYYEPGTEEDLEIEPGTTVRFVWISDNHDITIDEQPEDSEWEGVSPTRDTGFEHEWTFDVEGTYEFYCTPHEGLGMLGTIVVEEGITEAPAQPIPPGQQELDPHEIGVPLQKHFIGIATFLAMFMTLLFTFYVLKYGETPHSGYPDNK